MATFNQTIALFLAVPSKIEEAITRLHFHTNLIVKERPATYGKSKSSNAVSLVSKINNQAINRKASDIHLEPTNTNLLVKFRIDGYLSNIESIRSEYAQEMISRLKLLG